MLLDAKSLQRRVLPVAATSKIPSDRIDPAKGEDTLYGSRDDAKDQGLSVVFIPGLDIERECRCLI